MLNFSKKAFALAALKSYVFINSAVFMMAFTAAVLAQLH